MEIAIRHLPRDYVTIIINKFTSFDLGSKRSQLYSKHDL